MGGLENAFMVCSEYFACKLYFEQFSRQHEENNAIDDAELHFEPYITEIDMNKFCLFYSVWFMSFCKQNRHFSTFDAVVVLRRKKFMTENEKFNICNEEALSCLLWCSNDFISEKILLVIFAHNETFDLFVASKCFF